MSNAPAHVRRISDPKQRTLARFMAKVAPPDPTTGCWNWTAGKDDDGYGMFFYAGPTGTEVKGEKRRANRVSYELHVGPVPDDKVVRHSCDNKACVNHAHLVLGTHVDNVADRVQRKRSARGEQHGAHTNREAFARGAPAHPNVRRFPWKGRDMTLTEIAAESGVSRSLLVARIDKGWSIERAVSAPKMLNGAAVDATPP